MSFETQDVVVRRAETVADRIKAFELVPADGTPIRAFQPGGHIIVHLPNAISRHYSLTNAPGETDAYRIAVLDELDGRGGSAFMCNQLREGMTIPVSGPENNFPLEEKAAR
ncbi:MAG: FAD-binding oxidoreductase, partial [Alphaproteobacteria bacterium]